jgi:hypothetical protein
MCIATIVLCFLYVGLRGDESRAVVLMSTIVVTVPLWVSRRPRTSSSSYSLGLLLSMRVVV